MSTRRLPFLCIVLVAASASAVPASADQVSFVRDIMPVITRLGCNAGACHAKPAGQSGFKLSVFGYDTRSDHTAIVKDSRGRRIFPAAPDESLVLKKPTLLVEHGGGLRLKHDSPEYALLRRWIQSGMPYELPGEPNLIAVEVTPRERSYAKGETLPLRVTARYSDNSTRDVTTLADYLSNEKELAKIDESGI